MRSRIVRIGNSQGVRIPKPLLEQSGLEGDVDISASDGRIVIEMPRRARDGWAEAARALHDADHDRVESTGQTRFDQEEWAWR